MPFSQKPTLGDIDTPLHNVYFHVWGTTQDPIYFKEIKQVIDRTFHKKGLHIEAMSQKGTVMKNIEWGDMPGGLPYMVRNTKFNMSWFTEPTGFEPRGTVLYHSGLDIILEARCAPDRQSCDLVQSARGISCDEYTQFANMILKLSQKLCVLETMTAHQQMRYLPVITHAHKAKCLRTFKEAMVLLKKL